MLLVSGVAVTTLQERPATQMMENTVDDFLLFCSVARLRATEYGVDCIVQFNPSTNRFSTLADSSKTTVEIPTSSWDIPEDFTLDRDAFNNLSDNTEVEIFRFFPDGVGAGASSFTLKYGSLTRTITMSRLTGRMVVSDE